MAALPKLAWGSNQHREKVEVTDVTSTSYLKHRALRASVNRKLQSQADAVYAWGDVELIDRIRAGEVSVSDAFKGIKADFPIFAAGRSEKRGQDRRRATERP